MRKVPGFVGCMATALVITATTPRSAAAAPGAAEPRTAAPAFADVSASPEMRSPETVVAWATDGVDAGLVAAGVRGSEVGDRRLVVEVSGKMLGYDLSVGVREQGQWISGPNRTRCACDADGLVAHVEKEVAAVAPQLVAEPSTEAAPAAGSAPPVSPPTPAVTPAQDSSSRLGAGGRAGVGLLVTGGAAMIAGVVLLALPPRWSFDPEQSERRIGEHQRVPGAVVLGVGAAIAITGAVLLGRDRARAKRRVAFAPAATRTSLHLSAGFAF